MKNKETLEESSKDYIENTMKFSFNSLETKTQANRMLKCAEFGAKWQQERSYTEEDMRKYASYFFTHSKYISPKEWFEQFKNK
jgi:hypothetical protein